METALAPTPVASNDDGRRASGLMALAVMPEVEFEARLAILKAGQERIKALHRSLMIQDVDYGVIPGTNKPTLLKPGAEKLAYFYGLVAEFRDDVRFGDGEDAPHVTVISECLLHAHDLNGPVAGSGSGACSTWESKYRYRNAERACPTCGCAGTIRKSKFEDRNTGKRGWYCNERAGGCGAQFAPDDAGIVDQHPGRTHNEDAAELLNTIIKMAKKRAHMDAVLRTTCASGMYTQDMEDAAAAIPPIGSRAQRPAVEPSVPNGHANGEKNEAHSEHKCEDCGAAMTPGQTAISMRKYTRALCLKHQRAQAPQVQMTQAAQAAPAEETTHAEADSDTSDWD